MTFFQNKAIQFFGPLVLRAQRKKWHEWKMKKTNAARCGAARSFGLSLIGRGGIRGGEVELLFTKIQSKDRKTGSTKMKTARDWPDVNMEVYGRRMFVYIFM